MAGKVVIVDYGVGNLFNIQRAFSSLSVDAEISNKEATIRQADRILLPGVGAFGAGMTDLNETGLDNVVKDFALTERPIMGVCLGMQLMMSRSYEDGEWDGLGLVDGTVNRLIGSVSDKGRFKIPHIGWSSLLQPSNRASWDNAILANLQVFPSTHVYFAHSYVVDVESKTVVVAQTQYGDETFCSVFEKNNLYGCQFHPERSGRVGLQILENFVNM